MDIKTSVKYLKGVGPKKANILSKLGIFSVRDLLTYYPRDWLDRRNIKKICEVNDSEFVTLRGEIKLIDVIKLKPGLSMFKAAISDGTGIIYATAYKKPNYKYDVFQNLKKDFLPGRKVILYGKVTVEYGVKQINIDEYKILEKDDDKSISDFCRIVPVYQLTQGINQKFIREIISQALQKYLEFYPEIFNFKIRKSYGLFSIYYALKQIHHPDGFKEIEIARKRLVFEEFFLIQLAMTISKRQQKEYKKSHKYIIKKHLLGPFKNNLGFEFTLSQKKVINEIFSDMQRDIPMNRLLLGDVGSGKTVVALSAILLAIENNYQAVLMAPTEILAEQHYYTVKKFLKGLDVRVDLLTGSISSKARKKILEKISGGDTDIIIGTHALIEENVRFKNFVLAVIDEQHRFGVLQRQKLRSKAYGYPDILVMTATPIPRTLALTLYHDMDISVIDTLPPGRIPVQTFHVSEEEAYRYVRECVNRGERAYIVFPLIDDSDKLELKSVLKEGEKISKEYFPDLKVALLHGQMPGKIKEKIMDDFRTGKYDILVTTSVIEVGIDVPEATIMVINHAERFGLATLHQLRGRIGRGKKNSYCYITGNPSTEEAKKRFEIFCSTNNGFKIAEVDLQIRGPGEFFGTAQHGIRPFRIGDIIRDNELLLIAKKLAEEIISNDKYLIKPENQAMKSELLYSYGEKFNLSKIL